MQIAEITRAETSQRAALLTVSTYAVELDLTCGDKVFRSTSVITFECAEPGAEQLRRPGSPRRSARSR